MTAERGAGRKPRPVSAGWFSLVGWLLPMGVNQTNQTAVRLGRLPHETAKLAVGASLPSWVMVGWLLP